MPRAERNSLAGICHRSLLVGSVVVVYCLISCSLTPFAAARGGGLQVPQPGVQGWRSLRRCQAHPLQDGHADVAASREVLEDGLRCASIARFMEDDGRVDSEMDRRSVRPGDRANFEPSVVAGVTVGCASAVAGQ